MLTLAQLTYLQLIKIYQNLRSFKCKHSVPDQTNSKINKTQILRNIYCILPGWNLRISFIFSLKLFEKVCLLIWNKGTCNSSTKII